ncbi:MAG: NADP-dependent malic enzyme [Candidatus Micrarchaeota archaeon]|nr:NADP-dependent malic enzyme [Candidatus Micrarchaeota archaeon]
MNINEESLELHRKLRGKITIKGKVRIKTTNDLSLLYTPGVAEPCRIIAKDKSAVYDLTMKNNTVAIVTDGTRVLGLGDIGPEAALPVMEGKALIMKEFGNIDAIPICLNEKDPDQIVEIVKAIAPVFGAINLEDISTPKVFDIEERLTNELDIPVFHDDQHGTAMVVLAGLINALKITGKKKGEIKVVVNGSGSAGHAIAKLLLAYGIADITIFDRNGAIYSGRPNLEQHKAKMAEITNKQQFKGVLKDFEGADAIISATAPGGLSHDAIRKMNEQKIVFALANPISEISLEESKQLGIVVFGTGRSDYPNQLNNSVIFPGFLRALLDLRVKRITDKMKIAASEAVAKLVSKEELAVGKIIPDTFDKRLVKRIVKGVKKSLD